jgi:hypothetical protein
MLDYEVSIKSGKLYCLKSEGHNVDIEYFMGDKAWDRVNDIITLADMAGQISGIGCNGIVCEGNFKSFVYGCKVNAGLIKGKSK